MKQLKLEIPYEKKYEGIEYSETLVLSRYNEHNEFIYVDFGEYEAILHVNDVLEQLRSFLD